MTAVLLAVEALLVVWFVVRATEVRGRWRR